MFKYTNTTLHKIEDLMKDAGYIIRYEKGNFKAGYCILQTKQVVVINKYFDLESKINCFLEILPRLALDESKLSEKSFQLLNQLKKENQEN